MQGFTFTTIMEGVESKTEPTEVKEKYDISEWLRDMRIAGIRSEISEELEKYIKEMQNLLAKNHNQLQTTMH